MKRFAIGFVIGLIFAGIIVVILAFAAMRFGERKVTVADGSTLVLHMEGDMPEQPPVELPIPFLEQQQPMTLIETWQLLRTAASDSRIKALVLEPRDLSGIGWAKMQELHDEVLNFKKSGKPVYAYLRGPGAREYYVATAADKIYMAPEDELDLKGVRAQILYFKGTLDKLGVQMEFQHVGKYKDAPDEFTKTGPSPETIETTNEMLDQFYGNLVQVIADGRKKTPDQIKAALDNGPFVGKETIDNGFVDELAFEDEVFGRLKTQLNIEIKRIGGDDYAKAAVTGSNSGTKIAYVAGAGDITRGSTHESATDNGITATAMVKLLRQVENDNSIKAVIFRIDSPGGDGIASDDILHAAKQLATKKPMIISMSDLAASGGYFIAMTGNPIIAYPNTLTGSIGVFFGKPNLKGLFDKLGISQAVLQRGKFADIDDPARPLTPEESAKLQRELEVFYRNFVELVSTARKRAYDQVEPLAQGRVWLGEQAKQNGLVDELGGIDRAVEMIKQKANIPASEKVQLVVYPPKRSVWDIVFSRSDENAAIEMLVGKRLPLSMLRGGILTRLPYQIDFK
jgi:protease-4